MALYEEFSAKVLRRYPMLDRLQLWELGQDQDDRFRQMVKRTLIDCK